MMWLIMTLRMNIKKDICSKKVGLHAQNMTTTLGSIVNKSRADLYDNLYYEHENSHFDSE